MPWIIFALLAPLLWAASNIVDENLIRREIKNPLALVITTGLFGGIPFVFILATGKFAWPGFETFILAVCAGLVGLLVYWPYFKALQHTDPAKVVLMWNLSPVFVVFMARLILKEILSPQDYLAIAFLVSSSLLAAYKKTEHRIDGAFPWMLLASILLASEAIFEKAVFDRTSFVVGLGWSSLTMLVVAIFFIIVGRAARQELKKTFSFRIGRLIVFNEFLDVGAGVSASRATSLGPVSLTEPVGAIQPLFILIFQTIMFIKKRKKFTVKLKTAESVKIFISVALAVAGLALIKTL